MRLNKRKPKLKELREQKIKGIIIRTKAKWKVEGEKSTKYICNLEKRQYTKKIIPKLISEEGFEITDLKDILEEQKTFYKKLYTNTDIDNENIDTFLDEQNPFYTKVRCYSIRVY